jgi:hypothetical protein
MAYSPLKQLYDLIANGVGKLITRGGAKGATTAADVTSTNIDADHQALDVAVKALPTTAATSTKQSDGSQKSQTVDASGNVQPAGDTAARPIWAKLSDGAAALFDAAARAGFVKLTDGTNLMPTADAVGRALFAKITDGTTLLFDAAARAGWVKVTDGTNTMPSMDAVGRAGFVKVTDGTNTLPTGDAVGRAIFTKLTDGTTTAKIIAASTDIVASDQTQAVQISPNGATAKALTPQAALITPASITTGANTTQGQLSAQALVRGLRIQADPTNTINIRIGSSSTSATQGFQLMPGKSIDLPVTNANAVYYCNESAVASKLQYVGI